jgi:hypothetical protein
MICILLFLKHNGKIFSRVLFAGRRAPEPVQWPSGVSDEVPLNGCKDTKIKQDK